MISTNIEREDSKIAGNKTGGKQAEATNKALYGDDFYKRIGKIGGSAPKSKPSGFAANRELASRAGKLGGTISRRRPRDVV